MTESRQGRHQILQGNPFGFIDGRFQGVPTAVAGGRVRRGLGPLQEFAEGVGLKRCLIARREARRLASGLQLEGLVDKDA